jgi:hypothetical protein
LKPGGWGLRPISISQKEPILQSVFGGCFAAMEAFIAAVAARQIGWLPDDYASKRIHIHFRGRTVVGHWSIDDDCRTVTVETLAVCTLGRDATAIARQDFVA